MLFSSSLQRQLSIIFGILMVFLVIILSFLIGQRSIQEVQTEIGDSLADMAYLMGDKLDRYMWSRNGEVEIISEMQTIKEQENLNEIDQLLNQVRESFPAFSWIGLTNEAGEVISATDDILRGIDISERPVYQEALERPFIGDVHEAVLLAELLPNPTGEPMKFVDISMPITTDGGVFTGVLAAHLSWEWAKEVEMAMLNTLKGREDLEIFIVGKNHDVLLGPEEMLGHTLNFNELKHAEPDQAAWAVEKWDDGKEYLTGFALTDGYRDYEGLGWTVIVRQTVDEAYAPTKEMLSYFIVCGIILAVLSSLLASLVARRMAAPLKEISSIADRLRGGEKIDIPIYRGIEEIESLSISLRKLIKQLTKTETDLVEMENVASRDHLTGLANRNGLERYLDRVTHENTPLTILYLDLDGFKKVNDTLGHDAGDQLLIETGRRLKQNIENGEFVARLGGDEFILVLKSPEDPVQRGIDIGNRIVSMLGDAFIIDEHIVHVGCSVGGAVYHPEINNITSVIRLADEALYKVKRTGKNRVYMSEAH
ncbi:sensor domain-containing diguanylate cyclase [Bacillus mesophilum]|uniref:Diguanylate cyclase n=1 Tax=Bacillus mesophilum TaxID=1071718 RepID=A0A7V7RLU5_9BACI|nr:sensor domain-containing diguanylate cyclase [Bacillus mesophilum]KAB2332806.1 diguanylate cyclase [Bacillus mesophilum]